MQTSYTIKNEKSFIYFALNMRYKDPGKIPLLFDNALKIIGAKGLVGLKMSTLAREADMATGTVYLYFRNKANLLDAMYDYYQQKLAVSMAQGINEWATYEAQLRQKWYNYLLFLQQHPLEYYFFSQYRHANGRKGYIYSGRSDGLHSLRELLGKGQQIGILKKTPVELLLAHLCGSIYEILEASQDGRLGILTELTHHTWQMAWDAVRK